MSDRAFEPLIVKMTDVKPRPVSWLWPGRIPLGKVTLIGGDPGLGKSFLTTYLAAQVSTGADFPDGRTGLRKPGDVLILSAEDDAGDTIRPRLEAHGADLSRIRVLDGVVRSDGRSFAVDLDRHMAAIESAVRAMERCRLVIVDPITAYLGEVDGNSNAEVRSLIRALSEMASRHGPAVLCVTHLNKNGAGRAMYRMMGSLAFIAAARVAYLVSKDRTDPDLRVMVPAKANLAINPLGISFKIEQGAEGGEGGRVAFQSMEVELGDDEVDDPQRADERSMYDEALEFLRQMLAGGAAASADLMREGEGAGITAWALRRAKKTLGVRVFKSNVADGGWMWELPAPPPVLPGAGKPRAGGGS